MEDFNEDSVVNLLASDNYIVVNRSLIKELGLKEAILLGELASEYNYYKKNKLLNEDGYFYSTIENIKNNTSLSVFEQKKCLDNLSKRNIINVVLKGIPATRYIKINSYQLAILFANNLKTSLRETNKLDCEKLATKNNNKNNKEEKEIYKESWDCDAYVKNVADAEIGYLNELTGRNYRVDNPKSISLIRARLKEGFKVIDIMRVIETKCDEWLDTDMEKYLRPETLFGSKFENYVNQRRRK